MATAPISERPARRHTHKPNGHAEEDTERCPTCEQPVSWEKHLEIAGKLSAHDAEIERRIAARFSREMEKAEAAKKADIAQAVRQAVEAAETKLKLVRDQQAAAVAAAVKTERASATKKIATAVRAAKAAEEQMKKAAAQRDAVVKARVEAEREAGTKRLAAAVNAEKVGAFAEKMRLTEQLADMQRKLEQKTAHQIGEPAEVDLYEALVTAFPNDDIRRIGKGQRGVDVVMTVVHDGEPVGKVVFDSKAHSRWSNGFTRKLRSDQLREGAAFSILSTSVFPAGVQHVHLQDHVLCADPQRVIVLTHLLRRVIIDNHVAQLSEQQRDAKADRLYSYVCSAGFNDLLDRIVTLTNEIADLDRTETAAHQKVWNKRTALIVGLQAIHCELSTTVSGIIAGDSV